MEEALDLSFDRLLMMMMMMMIMISYTARYSGGKKSLLSFKENPSNGSRVTAERHTDMKKLIVFLFRNFAKVPTRWLNFMFV